MIEKRDCNEGEVGEMWGKVVYWVVEVYSQGEGSEGRREVVQTTREIIANSKRGDEGKRIYRN